MPIFWGDTEYQKVASPDPDLKRVYCDPPEARVSAGIGELTVLVTAYKVINDGDNEWKYFVIKLATVANPHGDDKIAHIKVKMWLKQLGSEDML